jgi:hypothetical protein
MTPYTIDDFFGTYQITQGSYYVDENDPRRAVTAESEVQIVAAHGGQADFTVVGAVGLGPLRCAFDADRQCLGYATEDYEGTGEPLVLQVSLYTDGAYKSVYGAMVFGDPENVGVWGADGGGGP